MHCGQRLPYEQHCFELYCLYRDAENRLARLISLRDNGRDISMETIHEAERAAREAKAVHAKAFTER